MTTTDKPSPEPDTDVPTAAQGEQVRRIQEAARAAIARGWAAVPLRPREKAPLLTDWTHASITLDQVEHAFRPVLGADGRRAAPNVEVRLGAASGGLVDVDCDTPEAVALAYDFLPPTNRISGHASNPASHRWYVVPPGSSAGKGGKGGKGGITRDRFASAPTPGNPNQPGTMLIELRGDGHQTMIPPLDPSIGRAGGLGARR